MVRRGRPRLDDPKSYKISIRLSNEQKAELESYCEKYNLNKTEVIMKGLEELLCRDVKAQKSK